MTSIKTPLYLTSIFKIYRDNFTFFIEDVKPMNNIQKIKYPLVYMTKRNVYKGVI